MGQAYTSLAQSMNTHLHGYCILWVCDPLGGPYVNRWDPDFLKSDHKCNWAGLNLIICRGYGPSQQTKKLLISWIIRVVTSGTSDRSMVSHSPPLYLYVVSSFVISCFLLKYSKSGNPTAKIMSYFPRRYLEEVWNLCIYFLSSFFFFRFLNSTPVFTWMESYSEFFFLLPSWVRTDGY